ncbi:hypothetical protein J7J95_03730 [bacterium]|nr:hypothetical protein [bacterium]
MFEEIKKYPLDFAFLFLGLGGLGLIFTAYSHFPTIQKQIVVVGGIFYFLWGVIHHLIRGDFCWRTVLEYLLFSAIAVGSAFLVLSWL